MRSFSKIWFYILIVGMMGCSHSPNWISNVKSESSAAPVIEAASVNQSLFDQWDEIFTALAKQELGSQKRLLKSTGESDVLPTAEADLQRALLLTLGNSEIKDVALAATLVSKYRSTQLELSSQARFAMIIVENKQDDINQLKALSSKLDALKDIEESMMGRGQ